MKDRSAILATPAPTRFANLAAAIDRLENQTLAKGGNSQLEISAGVLEQLAALALRMPAEHGLATGRWIVVRGPEARRRVAAAAYGQKLVSEAPALVVVLADLAPERILGDQAYRQAIEAGQLSPEEARRLSALASRAAGRWPDQAVWAVRHAMLTAGALMIGAAEIGLSARLVADFDHARLRAALGIPDDHEIAAIVALATEAAEEPAACKPPLEDLCFLDHFGQPWDSRGTQSDHRGPEE